MRSGEVLAAEISDVVVIADVPTIMIVGTLKKSEESFPDPQFTLICGILNFLHQAGLELMGIKLGSK